MVFDIVLKYFLGPSVGNESLQVDDKHVKAKTDTNIQHFVLLLKEKLEKPKLKTLICEIKAYKELGTIQSLSNLLTSYYEQKMITKQDIEQFRPFVRKEDESTFNKIL